MDEAFLREGVRSWRATRGAVRAFEAAIGEAFAALLERSRPVIAVALDVDAAAIRIRPKDRFDPEERCAVFARARCDRAVLVAGIAWDAASEPGGGDRAGAFVELRPRKKARRAALGWWNGRTGAVELAPDAAWRSAAPLDAETFDLEATLAEVERRLDEVLALARRFRRECRMRL